MVVNYFLTNFTILPPNGIKKEWTLFPTPIPELILFAALFN